MRKILSLILLLGNLYCQAQEGEDSVFDNKISLDFYKNINLAYRSYNAGAKAFKNRLFSESYQHMKTAVTVHDMYKYDVKNFENFGKKKKQFDTLAAEAYMTMANCRYLDGRYKKAIPLLQMAANNPITKIPSVYSNLINAYRIQKDTADAYKMIKEGRRLFPADEILRNHELNYLALSDTHNELIDKLYEAMAKDPRNPVLHYNIATTYLLIALPKNGEKPLNWQDLIARSEEAFQHALKLAPGNAEYNYNFGVLYFNQATEINDLMNALGHSAEDLRKYDSLKIKRNVFFIKSTPYFEDAYDAYSRNKSKIEHSDKKFYKSTLLALKVVYEKQNKLKKSKKMNRKYNQMK